jgi:Tol biopolymer transport system component
MMAKSLVRLLLVAIIGALPNVAAAQVSADTFPWRPLPPDVVSGSPDGRYAVVRIPATQAIVLRELASGRDTVLIEGAERWPSFVWSPDSRALAYGFDSADGSRRTYLISTVTRSQERLPVEAGVAGWTRRDEFLTRRGQAWVLVAARGSGTAREVARGVREVAVTPDGEAIIFQQRRTSPLVVRSLRTGEERRLTNLPDAREYGAIVSPDGALVLFAALRGDDVGLYVAPLDRTTPVTPLLLLDLTALEFRSDIVNAWWHDGGVVSVAHTISGLTSELYRIDLDPAPGVASSPVRRITGGGEWDVGPWISPDSKSIAFNRDPANALTDGHGSSLRIIPDASRPRGWYSATSILVDSVVGGQQQISAVETTTGRRTLLATLPVGPWQYVPALRQIFHFIPDSVSGGMLHAHSLSSGTERALAPTPGLRAFVASPDGKMVAYVTNAEFRLLRLGMPSDSLIMTLPRNDYPLAWAPDSRRLLYLNTAAQTLHVLNVDSGERRQLVPRPDRIISFGAYYDNSNGAWSPDGSFIIVNASFVEQRIGRQWHGLTSDAVSRLIGR